MKQVYFIGIGGIGMSALVRYFLSEGWEVAGSDISPSSITDELKKRGIKVLIGPQNAKNIKNPDLIVYNQAINDDNSELLAGRKKNIPCKLYAEILGGLTKKYKTIAISGAHGKSTTTALISLMLINAGFDPTVIIGTKLKQFGGTNFRKGKSKWLIIEADEWKGSFWNYYPFISLINNIDREHLDFYKNFSNVRKSFLRFIKNTDFNGIVIFNDQDENLNGLINKNNKILSKTLPYSRYFPIRKKIKKIFQIPGDHNIQNALGAYCVGKYLKIPEKKILKSLHKYSGAWRRMEFRGQLKAKSSKLKAMVYDDYAHHPTEIRATLAAFKEKWPKNDLICVFQAHQAERLKRLFSAFKTAFKDANYSIILSTYKVAGRDIKEEPKFSSKALAKAIKGIYVFDPDKKLMPILKSIILTAKFPITLVMMGAGNITKYTDKLLKIKVLR